MSLLVNAKIGSPALLIWAVFFLSWNYAIWWFNSYFSYSYMRASEWIFCVVCSLWGSAYSRVLGTWRQCLSLYFCLKGGGKGGYTTSPFLHLFSFFLWLFVAIYPHAYCIWLSYLAFWSAWSYTGAAFWKVFWFDDISDTRLEITFGKLRLMDGGGVIWKIVDIHGIVV